MTSFDFVKWKFLKSNLIKRESTDLISAVRYVNVNNVLKVEIKKIKITTELVWTSNNVSLKHFFF